MFLMINSFHKDHKTNIAIRESVRGLIKDFSEYLFYR